MARITDELRDGHTDYGAALRALSHVFFDWDRSDIAAVEVVFAQWVIEQSPIYP